MQNHRAIQVFSLFNQLYHTVTGVISKFQRQVDHGWQQCVKQSGLKYHMLVQFASSLGLES